MNDDCLQEDDEDIVRPISRKQEMYLASKNDLTIFGGAMGSGKSEIAAIDLLQYLDYPNFIAIVVRLTSDSLTSAGGMHVKISTYLEKVLGPQSKTTWKWYTQKKFFHIYHSNAKIYLKHFFNESDKTSFQGLEANLIYLDEGTQFTKSKFFVMRQRLRNPRCPEVNPHMKITCNPDADHFLKEFVEWYLLPSGRPDLSKDGVTRYFGVVDGSFVFGDTEEEVSVKLPKREVASKDQKEVLTYTFISANVFDNPVVIQNSPSYVPTLEAMPPIEKERNLYGNWLVRQSTSGYWKPDWCEIVDIPPVKGKRFRVWDISGTLKSDSNPDPDYTVGTLMSKSDGSYFVEDVVRGRWRHGGVLETILATAHFDGRSTIVVIPEDPAAAGKAYAAMLQKAISEAGFYCRKIRPRGSKVVRFAPFCSASEAGAVKICRGPWNADYILELEKFDGSRYKHDDQVDSTADAFYMLSKDNTTFNLSLPDMSKQNTLTKFL